MHCPVPRPGRDRFVSFEYIDPSDLPFALFVRCECGTSGMLMAGRDWNLELDLGKFWWVSVGVFLLDLSFCCGFLVTR